jgi:hypothetical protein
MDERIKAASKRIASYWGTDPVHMSTDGYRVVAEALEELAEECETGSSSAAAGIGTGTGAGIAPASRGETRTRRWESWISNDDAVASRAPEAKK